jgi:hypothetical protein
MRPDLLNLDGFIIFFSESLFGENLGLLEICERNSIKSLNVEKG